MAEVTIKARARTVPTRSRGPFGSSM